MAKFLSLALVTTVLCFGTAEYTNPVMAGTCASNCGPSPVKFVPGTRVTIAVVNQTAGLVMLQKVQDSDPIPLHPGQELQFGRWGGTKPNLSMLFWDQNNLPLRANITQPNAKTLRVELRPNYVPPGDRAVYMFSDGRVTVY
ncbi:MAG: hypothetical protein VKJ46_13775 [Leptolyngbyaceae bacterium]|nr:hypothetical protein [Leptolyngbyaceae bacterium]